MPGTASRKGVKEWRRPATIELLVSLAGLSGRRTRRVDETAVPWSRGGGSATAHGVEHVTGSPPFFHSPYSRQLMKKPPNYEREAVFEVLNSSSRDVPPLLEWTAEEIAEDMHRISMILEVNVSRANMLSHCRAWVRAQQLKRRAKR